MPDRRRRSTGAASGRRARESNRSWLTGALRNHWPMTGWIAVFADVPAGRAETAMWFWEAVTAAGALPAHGSHGEFFPLAARGEEPYL